MNHLTWEFLFEALNSYIQALQTVDGDTTLTSRYKRNWDAVLGLNDVLPRLHTHPQISQFIPYLAVNTFYWRPAEHYRISLDTWEGRSKYRFALFHDNAVEVQVIVPINEVPDTLLAFIQRAQQDMDHR